MAFIEVGSCPPAALQTPTNWQSMQNLHIAKTVRQKTFTAGVTFCIVFMNLYSGVNKIENKCLYLFVNIVVFKYVSDLQCNILLLLITWVLTDTAIM